jgi:DNA-binding response OmpR family regulator
MKKPGAGTKRILVVEDELAICDLCQRVLTGEGFEVDIAVNGKVALDMIEEQQYDLYLLDIKLPEMNGRELYQWLKEKHPKQISKVIFTSGSVLGKGTQLFIEQTSRPFLPKPFTPDELRTVVRETLKRIKND